MKDRGRRRGVAGRRSVVERGCEVLGAVADGCLRVEA